MTGSDGVAYVGSPQAVGSVDGEDERIFFSLGTWDVNLMWLIVICVVLAVVIILVIVTICCCCRRGDRGGSGHSSAKVYDMGTITRQEL